MYAALRDRRLDTLRDGWDMVAGQARPGQSPYTSQMNWAVAIQRSMMCVDVRRMLSNVFLKPRDTALKSVDALAGRAYAWKIQQVAGSWIESQFDRLLAAA